MCGIAGIISKESFLDGIRQIDLMTTAIAHRGPDGGKKWSSEDNRVVFGHRRLSIIDLTNEADQPMHYMNRYTIVFNGEIYNYLEIKENLITKGYKFKTKSDTEVLLALYHDKKELCLDKLDGMFSFCIYDQVENSLFLARDRFGEKPLYYTWHKGSLYFASEMKAFWAIGIPRVMNEKMLYNYLAFGYEENPEDKKETFFKGIEKFPAAHYGVVDFRSYKLSINRYWNLEYKFEDDSISLTEACEKFRELLYLSVSRRLRSDVPVGSSLSGGLDSSLIVTAIDRLDSKKEISRKTFSASFPGFLKDEKYYQDLVIKNIHVEPHFVYPDKDSMFQNLETILHHQEEPFGSPSINAQFEVFGLAKKNNVIVLMDGQGADEIAGGYHNYFYTFLIEQYRKNKQVYKEQFNAYRNLHATNEINPVIKDLRKAKIVSNIPPEIIENVQKIWSKYFSVPDFPFSKQFLQDHRKDKYFVKSRFKTLSESLHYSTTKFGLEQLLRYADRNSMAHSREVRLPFLNHTLVEFLFSLPATFKINNGWTKYLIRESFSDFLPKEIVWRKDKIGYEPPDVMSPSLRQRIVANADKTDKVLSTTEIAKMPMNILWRSFMYTEMG